MDQTPVASTEMASQNLDPRLFRMFQKPEGKVGVQGTFTHFVQPLRPIISLNYQILEQITAD